jgi:predicted dehydrogenase
MSKPIEAILIGAGQRGADSYAPYALQHPEALRFVAVAEPDPARRARFAAQHNIPTERQFTTWEDLLARPQLGAAALVCTQDWQHTGPALAALRDGYHVLLEKPMATTAAECRLLVQASEAAGRQLHICHLLRYTTHYNKIHDIIQSGVLGDIIDISLRENVAYWHMSHSYVRGNWRNSEQSSPMILAKCCHDLDILLWLLDDGRPGGRSCQRLTSMGSLTHFRPENAPPGAPARCLDGCPARETCLYYAPWIYLSQEPIWRDVIATGEGITRLAPQLYLEQPGMVRWLARFAPILRQITEYRGAPFSVVAIDPTPENLEKALREGPYGRCVYHCDNDVVDHQVVLMEFDGGITATLTMHGHSHNEHRNTRIEGTRGRLTAEFGTGGSRIVVDEHRSDKTTHYDTSAVDPNGHGGGDHALLHAFLESISSDGGTARTTARQSLASHLLAFAAEDSRLDGRAREAADLR